MSYYFSGGSEFFSSMEGTEEPSGGSYFVGKREELIAAKRSCRKIDDRDILVIHHQDAFYAIDSYCYREFSTLRNSDKPTFPPCCWSQRQLKFWFVWNVTVCKVPSSCHQINQCHNIETFYVLETAYSLSSPPQQMLEAHWWMETLRWVWHCWISITYFFQKQINEARKLPMELKKDEFSTVFLTIPTLQNYWTVHYTVCIEAVINLSNLHE